MRTATELLAAVQAAHAGDQIDLLTAAWLFRAGLLAGSLVDAGGYVLTEHGRLVAEATDSDARDRLLSAFVARAARETNGRADADRRTAKIIRLPDTIAARPTTGRRTAGRWLSIPVQVNWFDPLTEAEILANVTARAVGDFTPYPDPNTIEIIIPADEGASSIWKP